MPQPGSDSPIEDGETLFRRIPASQGWCDDKGVSPEAFRPHKINDITGLSLVRERFTALNRAAEGPSKKGYFVALLNVGELRAAGIEIEADDPNDPAHVIFARVESGYSRQLP